MGRCDDYPTGDIHEANFNRSVRNRQLVASNILVNLPPQEFL